ncbi:protein of unknown function [Blastococcus sp. DSM 46786]|uniref:DUF4190 domain-containing protein n=1 Tax=Blastococcus sp. DSM 46786 TaxID=1798227 RepID=UPI0008BB6321|nr:DUF4190 domain-containing protein [Blastococcus sp. DSM 46786]SEL23335.1 protein of unknown function [Blastococcus sp. DSM 46786]
MTYSGPNHPGADDPYRPAPAAWGQQPAPYGGPAQPGGYQGPPPPPPGGHPGPYGQPYPGPYGQPPYGGYPYAPPQRTNGMAIASMVLGILWLYWIGSILALVFGYVAKRQIQERGEAGGGMATAGIVLGWIGVGLFTLFVLFGVASTAGY